VNMLDRATGTFSKLGESICSWQRPCAGWGEKSSHRRRNVSALLSPFEGNLENFLADCVWEARFISHLNQKIRNPVTSWCSWATISRNFQ
jgi:hypothetical protein